jgi:hypothetical protein
MQKTIFVELFCNVISLGAKKQKLNKFGFRPPCDQNKKKLLPEIFVLNIPELFRVIKRKLVLTPY